MKVASTRTLLFGLLVLFLTCRKESTPDQTTIGKLNQGAGGGSEASSSASSTVQAMMASVETSALASSVASSSSGQVSFTFDSSKCPLTLEDTAAQWCTEYNPDCDPKFTAGYQYCYDTIYSQLAGSDCECVSEETPTVFCCIVQYHMQTGSCDYGADRACAQPWGSYYACVAMKCK